MVMAILQVGPPELTQALGDLLKAFFPAGTEQEISIELGTYSEGERQGIVCRINGAIEHRADLNRGQDPKRLSRVALLKCLQDLQPGKKLPWGILTGIRPTKIVHRLLDRGMGGQEAAEVLARDYLIQPDKIDLALEVAGLQRQYLLQPGEASKLVNVYVGIPFCPSRCAYCSFPSVIGKGMEIRVYLKVLEQEITALGRALADRGISVQTIYVGGGTPSILSAEELANLLHRCLDHLVSDKTVELTVEAGRPDTLDRAKLRVMAEAGVGRLSINPQTMVQHTLERIGRNHSPDQVREAFWLARECGFDNINMDIILGLPGETISDVMFTLKEISRLRPDSLTVHALALKRASNLRGRTDAMTDESTQGLQMQDAAEKTARGLGMRPYYLYRQKQIFNNLENVGYAKAGKESVYNIQIMEERQTVFGAGAGAASKIVNPADWSLTNFQHPKSPEAYYKRWQESLEERLQLLDRLLGH